MSLKEIYELGITELSIEPAHIYKVLSDLIEKIESGNILEIHKKLADFDIYAYEFLNQEEYYAKISNFPKLELLTSDHNYYKATFYRIRYHFTYFDIQSRKFNNILTYGIHLADNLKEWLDFHHNTLAEDLIEHLESELKKIDSINS